MKSNICVFSILLIIIVVYVGACRKAGHWLVKEDTQMQADAIVILMGSVADRVLEACDQYKKGGGGKVMVVEESMGVYKTLEARGAQIISNSKQVYNAIVAMGIPSDNIIILPGDATSTQMEAIIIREYLANKPGIDTLILVSSSFHTRRASMIFKSVFRKAKNPIYFFCSPSAYTKFDTGKWWRSKEGIQTVLLEYLKIANFFMFERKHLDRKEAIGSWQEVNTN
jgi:uncharacterized SAM-binding protein YcdF (DUF218 family)